MLLAIAGLAVGLVLLTWSADKFIDGAGALARLLGMAPLLVGILIVGFGTSAPEMLVSAMAAMEGAPALALGNAIGSNIANVGLILGLTALLSPILVHSNVVRQEIPLLIAALVLGVALMADLALTELDALLLLAALAGYVAFGVYQGVAQPADDLAGEFDAALPRESLRWALGWLVAGLLVLLASSRLLVWSATEIARAAGISELVIGLTIVALGTSLPELAASIASVRKNQHDIAVGNVVGSNVFNMLGVVGIASLIQPMAVEPLVLTRDCLVMGLLTAALAILCLRARRRGAAINRWQGSLLLLAYVGYNTALAIGVF